MLRPAAAAVLALITPALVALSHPGACAAPGPTEVSGIIYRDTVWTADRSPYVVVGDVEVMPGVMLEIQPGVVVQFRNVTEHHSDPLRSSKAELVVYGTLRAAGTQVSPIQFTAEEGTDLGSWGGILLYDSSSVIEFAEIRLAAVGTTIVKSSPTISNTAYVSNFTGIRAVSGAPNILHNTISLADTGIMLENAAGAVVSNNVIVNNSKGIVSSGGSGNEISHNDMSAANFGIRIEGSEGDRISSNDFNVNGRDDVAIYIESGRIGTVQNNNFYFDETVVGDPNAVFWYIQNHGPYDVPAQNNWWDTGGVPPDMVPQVIGDYIWDRTDDPACGAVVFQPYLEDPVDGTVGDNLPPLIEAPDTLAFSPNGDGAADDAEIAFTVSEESTVTVRVLGPSGSLVRALMSEQPVTAESIVAVWDGKAGGGTPVPEGRYTAEIVAVDKHGNVGAGTTAIWLDVTPPQVAVTSPPEGASETAFAVLEVRGTASDAIGLEVEVSCGGTAVDTSFDQATGAFSASVFLTPGDNVIAVEAMDLAGNVTRVERTVMLNPVIILDPPETPTARPSIPVTGRFGGVAGGAQVAAVRVNGAPAENVDLAAGMFSTTVTLTEGRNVVLAEALSASGGVLGSAVARVVHDAVPPVVTRVIPASGSVSPVSPSQIMAWIEDLPQVQGAEVAGVNPDTMSAWIDGAAVLPRYDAYSGRLTLDVPVRLDAGEHSIEMEVRDLAGNVRRHESRFTIDPTLATVVQPHEFPQGLAMVSIPLYPDPAFKDHREVLGFDDFSLARWSPESTGYVIHPDPALSPFTPGKGFWYSSPVKRNVEIRGSALPEDREVAVELYPGWNQIGVPYPFDVPLAALRVRTGDGREVSLAEAGSSGLVRPHLWGYSPQGYDTVEALAPWYGYWIRALAPVTLVFPAPVDLVGAAGGGKAVAPQRSAGTRANGSGVSVLGLVRSGPSGAVRQAGPGETQDPAGGWRVRLGVRSPEGADLANYAGAAPGATDGYDPPYDVDEPPAVGGPYLYFLEARWGRNSGAYSSSVRALPGAGGGQGPADMSWDFVVGRSAHAVFGAEVSSSGDSTGETSRNVVSLEWAPSGSFRPGMEIRIIDPAGGRVLANSAAGGKVEVSLAPGDEKVLRLEVRASVKSVELSGIMAFPSPFDPEKGIKIRYFLSGDADVRLVVYNAFGGTVYVSPLYGAGSEGGRQGMNQITWDGRTNLGNTAAGGLYVFQIIARSGSEIAHGFVKAAALPQR